MNARLTLDQDSFQKLLAAAFVMQEQRDTLWAKLTADDAQRLTEIVDTQQQILAQKLNLSSAMNLIADRTRKVTSAQSVAISTVDKDELVYRAASGRAAGWIGQRLVIDLSPAADCVRTGETLRCLDTEKGTRVDSGAPPVLASSFVAVPVPQQGKIAGMMEVIFGQVNAFTERDVRTCQLMAGLVSEALNRAADMEWKQSLAAERATLLETLEKIKPQLEKLVAAQLSGSGQANPPDQSANTNGKSSWNSLGKFLLDKQKKENKEEEAAPEPVPGEVGGTTSLSPEQQRVFDGWLKTVAWDEGKPPEEPPDSLLQLSEPGVEAEPVPPLTPRLQPEEKMPVGTENLVRPNPVAVPREKMVELEPEPEPEPEPATWQSNSPGENESFTYEPYEPVEHLSDFGRELAEPARATLELSEEELPRDVAWPDRLREIWQVHWADVALAVASVVFGVAIVWALWARPTPPQPALGRSATTRRQVSRRPPPPQLSFFEQVLVEMGLAEAPAAPAYMGNPQAQVWVDLHTALYYCRGADLSGKTEKGKFTTQIDAQRDQYEPAYRRACD
jgi:putative methionine-R-sulfoxide reductase with GAF domain